MAEPTQVHLSLGSNMQREHNISSGLDALAQHFGDVRISPVYESESVGFDGSPFYNLVATIHTTMPVGELVDLLHQIEADHGRQRSDKKFASRTLDIDVLTYGDATGVIDGVELPRAEILYHAFVLLPLVDVAANEKHPQEQITYADILAAKDFATQKLWQIPFQWPR